MGESGRTSIERGLAAVVVGLVVAAVTVIAVEPALRRFYPILEATPGLSVEESREILESLPRVTFVLLWGLYALASLIGGIAATLIAGRTQSWPALLTALVLMIAGTFTVVTVYQPLWFRFASFFTYPMAYLGYLAVRRQA
jgi:hypothetical protein